MFRQSHVTLYNIMFVDPVHDVSPLRESWNLLWPTFRRFQHMFIDSSFGRFSNIMFRETVSQLMRFLSRNWSRTKAWRRRMFEHVRTLIAGIRMYETDRTLPYERAMSAFYSTPYPKNSIIFPSSWARRSPLVGTRSSPDFYLHRSPRN